VPEAEEETAALVRHAAATLRLRDPLLERVRERGAEPLYREIELPLTEVLAAMEAAGVKVDTYRMGEITARLADRVEELESKAYELAGEEFMLGSTQQVARVLFETLGLTPGRKGKTGYSTDTRLALDPLGRNRPGDRGMARVLELLNTTSGRYGRSRRRTRGSATFNQTVAATGRLSPRARTYRRSRYTELGRESARRSSPRPGTSCSRPTAPGRAASRSCPQSQLKEAFDRGETSHCDRRGGHSRDRRR
jgi:DNA polymerase-1